MSSPYYADDHVTLWHGDCRDVTEWLSADVLVTDPPYGIGWRTGQMDAGRAPLREVVVGDQDTAVRDAALALWGPRPAIVFGSWRAPRPPRVNHRLIWHKATRKPGFATAPWFPNDEEIYVLGSGFVGRPSPTVITTREQRDGAAGEVARLGHPTPKPASLMESLIGKCIGSIADPFAGSGSTLVAAKSLGRQSIGVEIDERYCEIAARRLSQGVLDFGAVS